MPNPTVRPSPAGCVFDAYGTLFDVGGAVAQCAESFGPDAAAFVACWRDKQLQYTWLRSIQGRYVDFERITADALDYALEALAIGTPSLRDRLLELYFSLPAHPDAHGALAELRTAGIKVLILSNGTPAMLEQAAAASGLAPLLDGILSVESVGVYKPDARVYTLASTALAAPAEQIIFVSANAWDAYAAADFGFRAVWCNRRGQPRERLPTMPEREIRSLSELPAVLGSRPSV